MITQYDLNIHKTSLIKFVMFMESCKGFEEDAKKFYFLTSESSHLQLNYELIRPMAQKIIKNKTGPEIMRFFEQCRKNITLNKVNSKLPPAEKSAMLKDLKKNFYDGLIGDLMINKCFELAEIVMAEKVKEKFPITENDEIIGLNIYAQQDKMSEYKEKFDILIGDANAYQNIPGLSKN